MHTMTTAKEQRTIGGVELTRAEFAFVIEYVKDLNQRRAAKVAGKFSPQEVDAMMADERIQIAVQSILLKRLELANIDAAWLTQQFVENHFLARQDGKINASNQALLSIGKLATVDAFAAEKVQVTNGSDVVARLQRARARREEAAKPKPPSFF